MHLTPDINSENELNSENVSFSKKISRPFSIVLHLSLNHLTKFQHYVIFSGNTTKRHGYHESTRKLVKVLLKTFCINREKGHSF